MLRYLSAGESHGPCLLGIVEGVPAGLPLLEEDFLKDLQQRQKGYGRGGRMAIEQDQVKILGGVINGQTTGAPLALHIENRDWANWKDREIPPQTVPRPGHADLAGGLKYGLRDLRLVAERASARETAMRVAAGVVAKKLLAEFSIRLLGQVLAIGQAQAHRLDLPFPELAQRVESSDLRCADPQAEPAMREEIDQAKAAGDTVGGIFQVVAVGVPPGLGSHAQWDRRLDGLLTQAVMSIPAVKGVEIGEGFASAAKRGTEVHDEIFYRQGVFLRETSRAGGLEGGMSNGMPIVVRAAVKPIPTTLSPLRSVDIHTKRESPTHYQRSDVCIVPAASVVGEAMVAWVLAGALLEKFGGDNMAETKASLHAYLASLRQL